MRILRSRLLRGRAGAPGRRSCRRRAASQVKSGGRSDKIRTYNYKENRVTDHRIGLTLHTLDQVLAGQLDELTDALAADERRRQLGATSLSTDHAGPTCAVRAAARLRRRRRRAARRRGAVDGRAGVGLRRRRAGRRGEHEPRDRAGDRSTSTTCSSAARAGEPLQYVLGPWSSSASTCSSTGGCSSRAPRPRSSRRPRSTRWCALGARRGTARPVGRRRRPSYAVADLGTGSGALALALARALPDARGVGDRRERRRARGRARQPRRRRLAATRVRLARGSWFDALPAELRGRLRLVVSNPPYIAEHEVRRPAAPTSPTGSPATRW